MASADYPLDANGVAHVYSEPGDHGVHTPTVTPAVCFQGEWESTVNRIFGSVLEREAGVQSGVQPDNSGPRSSAVSGITSRRSTSRTRRATRDGSAMCGSMGN